MEVKKIVEGMTAPQVAQVIDDNFKNQNKILEEDIAKQNNVIGVSEYKDFSEAEAVNVGDVRKYNGFLYECVEATTGAFDASKWKKSSFKDETEKKFSELDLKTKNSIPQVYVNSMCEQLGGNLFNKDSIGIIKDKVFFDANSDKTKDLEGCNISEFIAVEHNSTYSIDSRANVKAYDVNMKFIESLDADETTLIIPENVYWIRFSYYAGWGDVMCFNKGESLLPNGERTFGLIPPEKLKDNSIGKEKLTAEIADEIKKFSELDLKTKNSIPQVHVNAITSQLGGNLFNKNGFGIIKDKMFYDAYTDKTQDREGYNVSEFIAVEPNVTYLIDGRVNIKGYDVNMKYIDKITAVDNTLTVPENVYWIRFSYYSGWGDVIYLNKGDSKDLKYGLVQSDKIKDGSIGKEKLSEDVQAKLNQIDTQQGIKKNGSFIKRGNLSQGQSLYFPKNSVSVKTYCTFSANIVGEFGTLQIGHGETEYTAAYIKIDSTQITAYSKLSDEYTIKVFTHGLTVENNIQVLIDKEKSTDLTITVSSNGKSYSFSWPSWYGNNGQPFVKVESGNLINCSFGWTSKGITSDIWAFGDSYFGVNGTIRWMAYLISEGHTNLIVNAYGGQGSVSAYEDLTNLFTIGTPKKILWCLGMNDVDSSTAVNSNWLNTFNSVRSLCESNNIELILATIPTVPSRINKYKNEIVRNSGYRYIDFDKAVGADETTGAWYSDMLHTDGVHPSETGALALYNQAIADMPELLNC